MFATLPCLALLIAGPSRPSSNGAHISHAAAGRGSGNFSGARPPDRHATEASTGARIGARLREPARIPGRRRPARCLLDGNSATWPTDHAALPDRAQPGCAGSCSTRAGCCADESCPDTDDPIARATRNSITPAQQPSRWPNLRFISGDRVGLLVYGQQIQQRVLPGRGPAHLRFIVEALAQARAEASEADHLRALLH